MSKPALDSVYSAYAAAITAADYDAAIGCLLKMQGLLAITPDVSHDTGGQGNRVQFRDLNIPAAIAECRRLKAETRMATAGPWQTTKVTYARADDVSDY